MLFIKNKIIPNNQCNIEFLLIQYYLNQKYKDKCKFFIDDKVKLSDDLNCNKLFK